MVSLVSDLTHDCCTAIMYQAQCWVQGITQINVPCSQGAQIDKLCTIMLYNVIDALVELC